jgi:hypothetical protein
MRKPRCKGYCLVDNESRTSKKKLNLEQLYKFPKDVIMILCYGNPKDGIFFYQSHVDLFSLIAHRQINSIYCE